MSALPLSRPRLMSVYEFAALPEASDGRYELQEGKIVMSPSPIPDHQYCQAELRAELRRQTPRGYEVLPEVDIDLQLAPPGAPGFVRIPDLVVVERSARKRVRAEGGLIRASEVLLAVEIISLGSRRTDTMVKHAEYADAGIPHYWIVDLAPPISLVACHLGGELGYVDAPAVTGTFRTREPFPVEIDLDALV